MEKNEIVSLNESKLAKIISESVKKVLKEADGEETYIRTRDADLAYEYFWKHVGTQHVDQIIVEALDKRALADVLTKLFKEYEIDDWNEYIRNVYKQAVEDLDASLRKRQK